MSSVRLAESSEPLEAVLIQREKMAQAKFPDLEMADKVVLKNGPQAYKVAIHWVVRDRHTGERHHHSVHIETYRKTKKDGWQLDAKHTVTLEESDDTSEARPLVSFLCTVLGTELPNEEGAYLIVPVSRERYNPRSLQELLRTLSTGDKANFITQILSATKDDPKALRALVTAASSDPSASKAAAAALNVARFSAAIDELEALIERNAPERDFQAHLSQNPWMFGSEYSALLDRRTWTRDEQQDFMLRRTTDGYLEVIEIKTPLGGKSLFIEDSSHATYYPRRELSEVLGQTMHYVEELEADSNRIRAKDDEKVCKIRTKIIIGCDGNEAEQEALHRLNAHLQCIEVLTFNQLLRIARRVVECVSAALPKHSVSAEDSPNV